MRRLQCCANCVAAFRHDRARTVTPQEASRIVGGSQPMNHIRACHEDRVYRLIESINPAATAKDAGDDAQAQRTSNTPAFAGPSLC
jgi:hypothetical protein